MIKWDPQLNLHLGLLGKMDSIQTIRRLGLEKPWLRITTLITQDSTVQCYNCDCDFCIAFKYFLFFSQSNWDLVFLFTKGCSQNVPTAPKPPHHAAWLTNAFEWRPRSSQSPGINWQLVGQQTHQALLLSEADESPGVDGNWLLVASNKPLHIHHQPRQQPAQIYVLFFFYGFSVLSFKQTKFSQHNHLRSRQTDRRTGWRNIWEPSQCLRWHTEWKHRQNGFVSLLDMKWSVHNVAL